MNIVFESNFGVLFIFIVALSVALLLILRILNALMSVGSSPRNSSFPIPCHPLQPQCSEYPGMREGFHDRITDLWAAKKRRFAAGVFAGLLRAAIVARGIVRFLRLRNMAPIAVAQIARRHKFVEHDLDLIVNRAYFLGMRFVIPGRAVAFAGRCRYHCPATVLGCETWYARWCPRHWLNSSYDHELTHCIQEILCGALTYECHGQAIVRSIAWITCEMHAHLFGGILLFSTAIAPLLLIFYLLFRLVG